MSTILLPGATVSPSDYPPNAGRALALGPGLQAEGATVRVTVAGALNSDSRKNAIWIESIGGRYLPAVGDLVVAVVHHSSAEMFNCMVTPYTPFALLGQLSFEGATKKTRPNLAAGALVYARISKVEPGGDVELECVNPSTGKADGMGPLKGGMVFDVAPGFARRIMLGQKGGVTILDDIAEKVRFEVAVGRNGKVWVDAGNVAATLHIGRALEETDELVLSSAEQQKLAKRILRNVQ